MNCFLVVIFFSPNISFIYIFSGCANNESRSESGRQEFDRFRQLGYSVHGKAQRSKFVISGAASRLTYLVYFRYSITLSDGRELSEGGGGLKRTFFHEAESENLSVPRCIFASVCRRAVALTTASMCSRMYLLPTMWVARIRRFYLAYRYKNQTVR